MTEVEKQEIEFLQYVAKLTDEEKDELLSLILEKLNSH